MPHTSFTINTGYEVEIHRQIQADEIDRLMSIDGVEKIWVSDVDAIVFFRNTKYTEAGIEFEVRNALDSHCSNSETVQ